MPLSEQEQRLLDEMERHLMRNEADVVSAPREGQSLSYRNIVYGAVLVLLSLGGLIAGVSSGIIAIGVVSFVVMVGGVVLALTPARNGTIGRSAGTAGTRKPAPANTSTFMDRMNERWDRRNGER
ncbi:DUF3040 domain-containing protein [Microbacterium oleivorans]|uniref:DUF3040 domain-containing protein n=1 Tax=Microbacterium oleivorans TaxID=273677 RepID=A0A7D5F8G4_9MICO|nr:DUF3040 domain-containing protein [Microbacterium oleivorans]QLD12853.1 DUF3040 domain-containing protein [Microbacterium oleivorans]